MTIMVTVTAATAVTITNAVTIIEVDQTDFNPANNFDSVDLTVTSDCEDIVIDFDNLKHGTQLDIDNGFNDNINDYLETLDPTQTDDIVLSGMANNEGSSRDTVIIYDSLFLGQDNDPGEDNDSDGTFGKDKDLEHNYKNAPTSGHDDEVSQDLIDSIDKLVIIPNNVVDTTPSDGIVDMPNDWAKGGDMQFNFQFGVIIGGFDMIDFEKKQELEVTAYSEINGGGFVIKTLETKGFGDRTVKHVDFVAENVKSLVFDNDGSGAITNILIPCEVPPVPCDCDKVVSMSVRYTGTSGATIQVAAKDDDKSFGIFKTFTNVQNGQILTILASEAPSSRGLHPETVFIVNGDENNKIRIHTSCSDPINVGDVHGVFTITALTLLEDKDNPNSICFEGTQPVGVRDDTAGTYEGQSVTLDVLANDVGVSYIGYVSQGSNGGVVTTDGTYITYTPPSGYIGPDTFTYTAHYTEGGTDVGTVSIDVMQIFDPTAGKKIALVVGKVNELHSQKDIPLKDHLELDLGHTVDIKDDNDKSWNPEEYDVVIISESVHSSKTEWLRDAEVPIVSVEGANADELILGDGGSSKGGKSTDIVIFDNSHPITDHLGPNEIVQVTVTDKNLGYMTEWDDESASQVQMLAYYNSAGEWKAKILVADKGDILADGETPAGDKRVFFGARYFANLNPAGILLFDKALEWACDVSSVAYTLASEAPVITLYGNNPMEIEQNTVFVDPGATAVDTLGNTLSVTVTGVVNTSVLGTYSLTYAATDDSGISELTSEVVRIVTVVDYSSTASSLNIAMVCGKSDCNNSNKDVPLKDHLTEVLGHIVTTFNDDDDSWTPTDFDVLIISESVKSSKTGELKDAAVPILTLEGANSDELAMADGGSSKGGKSKSIIIDDPSAHYITQGFAAGVPIPVTTSVNNLGHMKGYEGYGLEELARYDTSGSPKAKILVADAGAALVDGTSTAADKRVFFGAQYFANLNDNGITLFDRALEWTLMP
jgi:hypothetical protein